MTYFDERTQRDYERKLFNRLYISGAGNGLTKNKMSDFKTLRAKFKTDFVKDYGYGSREIEMSAVYSNNKDEDNQFAQATPSGSLKMMVSNPSALDFLKPGKKYYLDFTEAPDE